ncbi:MAG TPA: T9SS type A sorting domain-containing protein [Nitrosopumilaceae archaeon]|jgi:hypothetical protein|nr:T9SS type A sorting domain-containing protein [Nitrosopumilaceae archaeon]
MKKQILSLSLVLSASALFSQITITKNDIASPGIIAKQANDTAPTVLIGPAGTSQIWNFATLGTTTVDTMKFVLPSSTPNASKFPGSNLAIIQATAGTVPTTIYTNITTSIFQIDGVVTPFGAGTLVLPFNPTEEALSFPCTYGTNFNNTTKYVATVPISGSTVIDSAMIKHQQMKSFVVDAWGTLITPLGSFSTIRSKEHKQTIDSTFIHYIGPFPPAGWAFAPSSSSNPNPVIDTTYSFSWFANAVGYTIASVDSSTAHSKRPNHKTAKWLMATPAAAGIQAYTNTVSEVRTYPNPASTCVTFDTKGLNVSRMEVYNSIGEIVLSSSVNSDLLNISTTQLSDGVYFARFFDKGQAVKGSSRFYISK